MVGPLDQISQELGLHHLSANDSGSTRDKVAGGPFALLARILRREPRGIEVRELEHLRVTLDIADKDRIWAFIVVLLYAINKMRGTVRSLTFVVGLAFVAISIGLGTIFYISHQQNRSSEASDDTQGARMVTCAERHDPDYCAAVTAILSSAAKQRLVKWVAWLDDDVASRLAQWPALDRGLGYLSTLNPQRIDDMVDGRRSTADPATGGRHR